jgi:hypothetical protein
LKWQFVSGSTPLNPHPVPLLGSINEREEKKKRLKGKEIKVRKDLLQKMKFLFRDLAYPLVVALVVLVVLVVLVLVLVVVVV